MRPAFVLENNRVISNTKIKKRRNKTVFKYSNIRFIQRRNLERTEQILWQKQA